MPELDFRIQDARPANHGITPLLEFELRVDNRPETEEIQALALHAQVQIECPKRGYSPQERERLVELFGTPERWGDTLRSRLWTHIDATVPPFTGSTTVRLTVPCTYDLNIAATKYFHALESGEIPLLFLYSGTVFYLNEAGQLQVSRISWDKESSFRLPVQAWREAIDYHFPHSAWVAMDRDIFEQLAAFKREHSIATWEQTFKWLLAQHPSPRETALT